MENMKICEKLMAYALKAAGEGAHAEVILSEGTKKSVGVLGGKPQSYDSASSRGISLTVFIGLKQASSSSEDFSDKALKILAEETTEMARFTPENKDAFLAKPGQFITDVAARAKALNLADESAKEFSVTDLQNMAYKLENGALSVEGATKCSAVEVKTNTGYVHILTSEGFKASVPSTSYVVFLSVLAGEGDDQTSDGDVSVKRHFSDLPDLEKLGRETAQRAVKKVGARPIKSGRMPIVFDKDIAPELLDMFAGAISGMAVDKGTTFLKDAMGEKVFSDAVTIVDDPTIPKALGSDPCDSDGIASTPLTLIENGKLKHWLLSLASAKRLGLEPNGRADGTTNLYMKPGNIGRDDLISGIKHGFLVTDMMGHSLNLTTGDFSRGAEGFLIEDGKITKPVSEVTIAGNLKDMFLNMTPADDLEMEMATNAPSVLVKEMMVAGV